MHSLKGIMVPLITPLIDNDSIDFEGLERLIEHTISGGIHGVFILGTSGEFASLSHRLRKQLIECTGKLIKGRLPFLVGISDSAFSESLNLAKKAEECGADAVVLAPPYYFATSQSELLQYLQRIMPQIPLPLFLYNIPVYTKVIFAPETVKVAAEIKGIIGMKDSSLNLAYLNQVRHKLKSHRDFVFMVGPEEILAEFVLLGGHGGVHGGANVFPHLYVELYQAAVERDFEKINLLQQKVIEIYTSFCDVGLYESSYLKSLKCALSIMGICNDFVAEPFQRYKGPERCKIEQLLNKFNNKN